MTTEAWTTSQVSRVWAASAAGMAIVGALFGNPLLFALGVLLGTVLLIAWASARRSLTDLTIERRFSHSRAFFGENVDLAHVFTNNKPLPLAWLFIEDRFPSALQIDSPHVTRTETPNRSALTAALSLGWYERVTRHYEVHCTARGEHDFGPIQVESGDLFGLFRHIATRDSPGSLLVYPRYVPVTSLGIPARQPFGEFKAAQNLATDPLRLRAVREYAYGDNPRHIHWKATARRGELQTRLFEPAATPQLFIFCNQDTFVRMWEGLDLETLELTITVAASLANHALEEGYMVGLHVNAFALRSDTQVRIPPNRDPAQLTRILESLARVTGWSGLPMEDLIRAERRNLPIAATVVVVTGVLTEEMLDLLLALRRSGHPVTLVETSGSARPTGGARSAHPDALLSQGITYYKVDAVGQAKEITSLAFA
ncbi:MAG: DUF58 domain-containing protein [Chloroflexia bacterium]